MAEQSGEKMRKGEQGKGGLLHIKRIKIKYNKKLLKESAAKCYTIKLLNLQAIRDIAVKKHANIGHSDNIIISTLPNLIVSKH